MKTALYKTLMVIIMLILSTIITGYSDSEVPYTYDKRMDANYKLSLKPELTLLYDNVWATVYHPESSQCDDSPDRTGDGSKIDLNNVNKLRWIAISQEMLNCIERQKLMTYSRSELYKGKIQYGDTILVMSNHTEINGWWVVHDAKSANLRKSIDFLQSNDRKSLYGKWDDVKIYKVDNISYKEYSRRILTL